MGSPPPAKISETGREPNPRPVTRSTVTSADPVDLVVLLRSRGSVSVRFAIQSLLGGGEQRIGDPSRLSRAEARISRLAWSLLADP